MTLLRPARLPPVGLEMLSLALGMTGLLLFFLPILGIPIGLAGLLCGLLALVAGLFGARLRLRQSLAGVVLSLAALGLGILMDRAPSGYIRPQGAGSPWQAAPQHPYIPPPARPSGDL